MMIFDLYTKMIYLFMIVNKITRQFGFSSVVIENTCQSAAITQYIT